MAISVSYWGCIRGQIPVYRTQGLNSPQRSLRHNLALIEILAPKLFTSALRPSPSAMPSHSSKKPAYSYFNSNRSESSTYEQLHQPLLPREQALMVERFRETLSQTSEAHSPPASKVPGRREVDNDKPLSQNEQFDPAKLYAETKRQSVTNIEVPTPRHLLYGGEGTGTHLPSKHPLFPTLFEPPKWRQLILHFITCLLAYPAMVVCVLIAHEKTLFWARAVVSLGGGFVGVAIGLNLVALGRSYLEAATWATIIHQSKEGENGGVRLRDVAPSAFDPTSIYPALLLLWTRSRYSGTGSRSRGNYDKKPWSLFIVVFLLLILSAASMPFIIGRIIPIQSSTTNQLLDYSEIAVKGDISDDDLTRAAQIVPIFSDYAVTWTLSPFSSHGSLPAPVALQFQNDTVYFSEVINSQLRPNGTGFGTFSPDAVTASVNVTDTTGSAAGRNDDPDQLASENILRFPRWGTRIHCEKIPDGANNILPRANSSMTYLFVPRDTFSSLFSSFGLALPNELKQPLNASSFLVGNDTLPNNLNVQATAKAIPFYDNGVAHSLFSQPVYDLSITGAGFVSIEVVLVRLNTTYAPHGKFATLSVPDTNGTATSIGYDAAVCLQVFEPWILDALNSSVGLPTTINIVEKAAQTTDLNNFERLHGNRLESVTRELKSAKLSDVYIIAHQNSVNQILKDNGRDAKYVPSPTVVSYTDGWNPLGYTELSAVRFAQARALADASNFLPYFAGSGDIVARSYPNRTVYSAHIDVISMIIFLISVLVIGTMAGLCVPRLPLGVPRRGFSLYSWIAAFHGSELVGTSTEEASGFAQRMELNDIERTMGDLRFRYAF